MNHFRLFMLLTYLLCLVAPGTLWAQTGSSPADLAVVAYGNVGLELSWTDNTTTETGFELYSSSDNRTFNKAADVPAHMGTGKMTYTLTGLSENTLYYFKVRAKAGTTFTDYSNTVNSRTLGYSAPNDLKLTVKSSTWVQLGWTDVVKEGIYEVERRTGQSGRWSKLGESGPGYDDKTASESTEYCYRVRQTGSSTISTYPYSNAPCTTTTSSKPPAPMGLSAQVISSYQIDLSWTPSIGNYDGTEVERSTDNRTFTKIGSTLRPGTNRQSVTGLSPNTHYWFRVRVTNGTNTPSDYSNTVDATTPPEIPLTPTGLTVSVTSPTQLQVYWNDSNVIPVTYSLERAEGTGGTYREIATGYASKIYDDRSLNPSTQYCYRVRAKSNSGGYSNYATSACNTTQAPPPTAPARPTNLKATAQSSTEIKLTWTDNSPNETRFELQRSLTGNDPWENVDTNIQPNTQEKIDGGRNPSTRYYYRIRAVLVVGTNTLNSDWSDVANEITQAPPIIVPQPPTGLQATAASSSQINLKWTPTTSTFGLGYIIEQTSTQGGAYTAIAEVNGLASSAFSVTGLQSNTQYCYRLRTKYTTNSNPSTEACQTTQAPPPQKPAAPTDLVVTVKSSNEILVAWKDRSDNETGFEIDRSEDGGTTWKTVKTEGRNVESYADGGLTAGKNYCYRVRAVTATDQSAYVGPKCETTTPAPAGAPQSFGATALSTTDIKLTWTSVAGASSYELDRSLTGTDPWTRATNPAGNAIEFTDGGRTANTRYYYRIRALNAANVPGPYSTADATTKSLPVLIPEPPTNLIATTVSATQIDLKWTASTATFGSGYVVEQSSPQGGSYTPIAETSGLATNVFSVTGLQPSTQYCYRVRTKYTTNSNPSTEACATTQALPLTPPRAPTGLIVAAISSTDIKLSWTDNSTNESGFEIEQGDTQTGTFTRIQTTGADAKEFIVSGLQSSRNYCFQVRAINGAGKSTYAGPLCVTTQAPPVVKPAAPEALMATAVSTMQINLSWVDKSANETGFELQWNTTGNDPWTSLPTQASNVTTFVHTGLTPNTRYYYRVRAVNSAGPSDWTTASNSTPNLPVPTTSTDLKAELADYDRAKLTWMPVSNDPTSIIVERSTSPTSGFTSVTQLAGTATQYTDKDLAEKTTYYYRIRALNTYGSSDNSNVAPVTTPETIIAVRRQPLPEGIYAHVNGLTLLVTLNWSYFQEATLRIVSLTGRDLLSDQCRSNGTTLFQYDVAHLPAGIYILCLDTTDTRYTKTIWIP